MLTLFLCFVAFAAVGQAAYVCPRHHSAEKIYAPPARLPRAVSSSNNTDLDAPRLVMISGGLEDNAVQVQNDAGIRRAA